MSCWIQLAYSKMRTILTSREMRFSNLVHWIGTATEEVSIITITRFLHKMVVLTLIFSLLTTKIWVIRMAKQSEISHLLITQMVSYKRQTVESISLGSTGIPLFSLSMQVENLGMVICLAYSGTQVASISNRWQEEQETIAICRVRRILSILVPIAATIGWLSISWIKIPSKNN